MRPTAPKVAKRSKSGPHAAKLNLSPYKTRTDGTLVCIAQTRENAPRGPVGRFTGILEHRKGNGDMEHIDALEAVRRLTLERDALAEQVRRLEGGNAPQATERRATAKTDAETGEGGNGAPRGCMVPSWGKIVRDVIWCASLALQNEIRLADARKDWDELRRLQKGKMALDRMRDELSNMTAPQTCERCKHAVPGAHAMLCTHHSPHTTGQHGERGQWPVVLKTDRCGDWEGK